MTFVTMKNFNRTLFPQELCFTANVAGSTVRLQRNGDATVVTLEISTNGATWTPYTIGDTITLANIGDKVYWRNTSESTTSFSIGASDNYNFVMTGSISASGDINYLINKNSTNTLSSSSCFQGLFANCTSLISSPDLLATTLTNNCYYGMFSGCVNLEAIPSLPATTLTSNCYRSMFNGCSKIKLSSTQTGEYQTEYRIPITGSGTAGSYSMRDMFSSTGGTFTGTPTINTTYYTSNILV